MSMTFEQIVEETRQMSSEMVAELVNRIMATRHGGIEPHIEEAWKAEVQRRGEELATGKVACIPAEETFARMRKKLGL